MPIQNLEGVSLLKNPALVSFDQVAAQLDPLITKYSGKFVEGMDRDDIRQHLMITLWKCVKSYDSSGQVRGHEGRSSSFLNFVIHAFHNTIIKLRIASQKFYKPIVAMQCKACGTTIDRTPLTPTRVECSTCGKAIWEYLRGSSVRSYDGLVEAGDPTVLSLQDEERDEVFLGVSPNVDFILWQLDDDQRELAWHVLRGGELTIAERRRLAEAAWLEDLVAL